MFPPNMSFNPPFALPPPGRPLLLRLPSAPRPSARLSGLGLCGGVLLQELLNNGLGGSIHLLQGFFGEDCPRSALFFLSLSCPILFGVALCRRLGLGQSTGLGQDP